MIKPYHPHHEETVLEIWYRASAMAHHFLGTETLLLHKAIVKSDYLPIAQTWVYEHQGNVAGFISMLDHYIGGLFISPEFQHKSIGSTLINHVKKAFPVLTVGVYEKNTGARIFYKKNGFRELSTVLQDEAGERIINMDFTS